MILEKAMAKLYGGYKNLMDEGNVEDFLKFLTGAPVKSIKTSDH